MPNHSAFQGTDQDEDEEEDEDDEDEEDEDEDDEDSHVMFDGTCRLFERIVGENDEIVENDRKSLGIVDLKILYDDDVYGARIVAVEHDQVRNR
jgi:hypothetical protein